MSDKHNHDDASENITILYKDSSSDEELKPWEMLA